MSEILSKIVAKKREEVAALKRSNPLNLTHATPPLALRSFSQAMKQHKTAIIAEIKKASPSKGILREDFDVAELAEIYSDNGAAAISVLTDETFFQGNSEYIITAKNASNLPILRKEFIIDEYQIKESLFLGADCILLIAAILDPYQLFDYCQMAQSLGMDVLVESHTEKELECALSLPTEFMGINNRNLQTFDISLETTINLKRYIPKDRVAITESGIHERKDIEYMQSHDINHFLIGESLMKQSNIALHLKSLLNLC